MSPVLDIGECKDVIKEKIMSSDFNGDNSRLVFSVCSDDCNRLEIRENMEKSLTRIYGREFHLGGVAGYPIGGVSAIIAASHHVPDYHSAKTGQTTKGNLIFFISPHVGFIKKDVFLYGRLIRPGQQNPTACCGAMMGFLNELKRAGDVETFNIVPDHDNLDPTRILLHETLIKEYPSQLREILKIEDVNTQIIKLSILNYELISHKVTKMIDEFLRKEYEVFQGKIAIITGITINCISRDFFVLRSIKILKN